MPPAVPILVDADGPDVVALRRHTEADVPRILEQCLDPLMQRWTTIPVPYAIDDARRFVSQIVPAGWESGEDLSLAIDVGGRFGGTLSLRERGPGRAEIGYGAHPDVRGTGVMERALRLLLGWAFDPAGLDIETVIWWADRGNFASRRLAWRVGFDITPGVVRHWLPQRGELLDGWVGTLLASDERVPRTAWLEVPAIESDRTSLRLRRADERDQPRVVEACQDPTTSHWIASIPRPYPSAYAADWAMRSGEDAASGRVLRLVAADRDDNRLLAVVDLFSISATYRNAELGYWVHPAERRRGVAAEAVRLACRHALLPAEEGGLGLIRLMAHAGVDNAASRSVLSGAGFREVGVERLGTRTPDGPADSVGYELVSLAASRGPR